MKYQNPLYSLVRGLFAGAVGSGVQSLFFRATQRIAPRPPEGVFEPPEPEQRNEQATQTVARRFVEGMMVRRPLTEEQKVMGGQIVHYAFGAAWGGLYGLTRATFPKAATIPGALAFGTFVWAVSDNVILPAFRLGGWPNVYPPKTHAYAIAAHLVYGLGLQAGYRAASPAAITALGASLWIARKRLGAARILPRSLRPVAGLFIGAAARALRRRHMADLRGVLRAA